MNKATDSFDIIFLLLDNNINYVHGIEKLVKDECLLLSFVIFFGILYY